MPKPGIYRGHVVNMEHGKSPSKGTPFVQVDVNLEQVWDGSDWRQNGGGYVFSQRIWFTLDPAKKHTHDYGYADLAHYGVTDLRTLSYGDEEVEVEVYESDRTYETKDGETRNSIEMKPYRPSRGGGRQVSDEERPDEKTVETLGARFAAFREKQSLSAPVDRQSPSKEPSDALPF